MHLRMDLCLKMDLFLTSVFGHLPTYILSHIKCIALMASEGRTISFDKIMVELSELHIYFFNALPTNTKKFLSNVLLESLILMFSLSPLIVIISSGHLTPITCLGLGKINWSSLSSSTLDNTRQCFYNFFYNLKDFPYYLFLYNEQVK